MSSSLNDVTVVMERGAKSLRFSHKYRDGMGRDVKNYYRATSFMDTL
jgi:hypothetical protein